MDLRARLRTDAPAAQRRAGRPDTRRRTVAVPALELHAARHAAATEMLTDAIAHEAAQPMQALSSVLRELQLRTDDGVLAALATEGVQWLDELRVLQDELRDAVSARRGERLRGTHVQALLAAAEQRLRPAARAAHVALSLRSPPYWLRVDDAILRRIVCLLADNAVRHSGASKVAVRAFADSRQLLIAVRDDGAGLPDDVLARLSAAPAPPAMAAADAGRGTRHGHGLSICRMLLARLNGQLLVRTSARATTFFVHLPRPVLCAAPMPGAAAEPAALHGQVVAMLDDDAAALNASARLFEALGAQVAAFGEPLDLLAACPTMPRAPRLFILDYRLRDGTCQRVIEALRLWLKDDFHCVVLTGDDAAAKLPGLSGDVLVAAKPLNDWSLERIQRFLRGECARVGGTPATRG